MKLANQKLDECRRRVQNETLGSRGRRDEPAVSLPDRLLTKAHERLDVSGETKLVGLLRAGDPRGEVKDAWTAKEATRDIYQISDVTLAEEYVCDLATDMQDPDYPLEARSLGRTLARWFDEITHWHRAFVSNGPTEAINNLIPVFG